MARHYVVSGKQGNSTRFDAAAELFESVVPGSRAILGAKNLKFIDELPEGKMYALHLVCHGSPGSIQLGSPRTVTTLLKALVKANRVPAIFVIYACHAADENGTAYKAYEYLKAKGYKCAVAGVGACDAVSCEDDDGNELPSGTVLGFLDTLLKIDPETATTKFLGSIYAPGICPGSDEILPRRSVLFSTVSAPVKRVFGKLNHDRENQIARDLQMILDC